MRYENPVAQIDETWIEEWVSAGLHELERYLQKYAAFEEYCRLRIARHPAGA
jgi:hypothetical protein